MQELYQYEFENYFFSEDGLDKKIALDRYAVKEMDQSKYQINDLVLFQTEYNGPMNIGYISDEIQNKLVKVNDLKNCTYFDIPIELVSKPLEITPQELWDRWSEALVSQESNDYSKWRNEYRWLFDGFRFSPGGRIMLALGQEYTNIQKDIILKYCEKDLPIPAISPKSNLTLYNCFVGTKTPGVVNPSEEENPYEFYIRPEVIKISDKTLALQQFRNFIDKSLKEEANVMKHGGGYGTNISSINTVISTSLKKEDIVFYIPNCNEEVYASINITKLGQYSTVITDEEKLKEYESYEKIVIEDDLDNILDNLNQFTELAFANKKIIIHFTKIRERGKYIKKINGRSSGRVAWAELYETFAYLLSLEYVDAIDFAEAHSKLVHIIQQGGCVSADTLVLTNKGNITAKDLFESNDDSIQVLTHEGYKKISEKFYNGKKKTYRVTTRYGYSVKTSKDHKYLVFKNKDFDTEMLKFSDIKIGDMIFILNEKTFDKNHTSKSNLFKNTIVDEIISIEELQEEDVYDFEVEDVHMLSFNGIYTSNSRRGALLILLEASRLDIIDKFVNRKKEINPVTNLGRWLTGANISIGIDDHFMKIVDECIEKRNIFSKSTKYYEMITLALENNPHSLTKPEYYALKNGIFLQSCNDIKIFEKIIFKIWSHVIEASYSSAEPGVIFLERYNKFSNSYYYANIVSTNPCGTR